jgi:hypothetical protein
MDQIMEVLPDDVMHLRHYQGHWYKNENLLDSVVEKDEPLPQKVMDTVRNKIANNKAVNKVYEKAKSAAMQSGVDWIEPVERPAQYH